MSARTLILGLVVCSGFIAGAWASEPLPLVTVTGSADVRVVPDEVVITVTISEQKKEIGASRDAVTARVKRVCEAARALGVAEKDIQTDRLTIEPESRQTAEYQWEFVGYKTVQRMAITLRDVAQYEALLTAVLQVPINELNGIAWHSSKAAERRAEARLLAMKAAREKAGALAEALGQRVGVAHTITEDANQGWWYGSANSNVLVPTAERADITSVAPGELAITASVTVSFTLLSGQ